MTPARQPSARASTRRIDPRRSVVNALRLVRAVRGVSKRPVTRDFTVQPTVAGCRAALPFHAEQMLVRLGPVCSARSPCYRPDPGAVSRAIIETASRDTSPGIDIGAERRRGTHLHTDTDETPAARNTAPPHPAFHSERHSRSLVRVRAFKAPRCLLQSSAERTV